MYDILRIKMEVMWTILWFLVMFLLYVFLQWRMKRKSCGGDYLRLPGTFVVTQQEQNIYNISGRVPNTNANQYPDAYLSVQHIAITNELNKPPKYDDAPPSYEDAIKMAIAQSNSLQTLQAEQTLRQEGTSSNSSSTPAVAPAVACPAVPNRTTE